MPTWIQRLKFFLGWNEKYKNPNLDEVKDLNKQEEDSSFLK